MGPALGRLVIETSLKRQHFNRGLRGEKVSATEQSQGRGVSGTGNLKCIGHEADGGLACSGTYLKSSAGVGKVGGCGVSEAESDTRKKWKGRRRLDHECLCRTQ